MLSKLDYKTVFECPISIKSHSFTLLAHVTANPWPRLGVIIAKRFMKKAVDRNRVRRLIRESFRLNQQHLSRLDIVVLVRCNCADQSNGALYNCLRKLWQDLNRRCNKG